MPLSLLTESHSVELSPLFCVFDCCRRSVHAILDSFLFADSAAITILVPLEFLCLKVQKDPLDAIEHSTNVILLDF